jgi:hypothetical protein
MYGMCAIGLARFQQQSHRKLANCTYETEATYCPDQGRPAISTRLMVSLRYLMYIHNLSDEGALDGRYEFGCKVSVAAIEPGIGHVKREHRMDRNRLKGTEGDRINAILCAAGMNFRKLQRFAAAFLRSLFLQYFGGCQRPWYRFGFQRACG